MANEAGRTGTDDEVITLAEAGDIFPVKQDEIQQARADFNKAAALYAERQNIKGTLSVCQELAKRPF